MIEAQVDMPVAGAITLYVSLLTFTLHIHPDRLDYVDQILVWLTLCHASQLLLVKVPHRYLNRVHIVPRKRRLKI